MRFPPNAYRKYMETNEVSNFFSDLSCFWLGQATKHSSVPFFVPHGQQRRERELQEAALAKEIAEEGDEEDMM